MERNLLKSWGSAVPPAHRQRGSGPSCGLTGVSGSSAAPRSAGSGPGLPLLGCGLTSFSKLQEREGRIAVGTRGTESIIDLNTRINGASASVKFLFRHSSPPQGGSGFRHGSAPVSILMTSAVPEQERTAEPAASTQRTANKPRTSRMQRREKEGGRDVENKRRRAL